MDQTTARVLVRMLFFFFGSWIASATAAESTPPGRRIISLNGTWQIGEGAMDRAPAKFDRTIPVPGLADMATLPFAEVGTPKSGQLRKAFWYRRSFTLAEPIPASVRLKIFKAQYGARVYLNGKLVGEHLPCFTPGEFDIRPFLKEPGQPNELIVRVGASRDVLPAGMPTGNDWEKSQYIPGIYDSVELILSGLPRIANVQTAPDIEGKTVRVVAELEGATTADSKAICRVREAGSGREVGTVETTYAIKDGRAIVDLRVPIENCRLWSPENPFLYEVEVCTGGDSLQSRFGMRSFRLDHKTGRAVLNGKTYFLRGTNVCIHRFFEDPPRGSLPWNEQWVRKLHRTFKGMHWNSIRYCIGFPPEMWYRIADEEGVLIQDEFPLWSGGPELENLKVDVLAAEYKEWMRERWNHPCVVIWDAQNETFAGDKTSKAIQAVRRLDLSHRPWDNGWSPPQAADDCYEAHPYLYSFPGFRFADFARISGEPGGAEGTPGPGFLNTGKNPIILNEYWWAELDREGNPCRGRADFYRKFLGAGNTVAQRREFLAQQWAAETEFWRARRKLAGLMLFCGLCYCKPHTPQVVTSDQFIDIEKLTMEPVFERYLRDAFAPLGIMVDFWAAQAAAGKPQPVSVAVTNDLDKPWDGTVSLSLLRGRNPVCQEAKACHVANFGTKKLEFVVPIPSARGRYQLIARLLKAGEKPVESFRQFDVCPENEISEELPIDKVTASSSVTVDGVTYRAANAADGNIWTRWSSEFSDPQWIAVDLGKPQRISRVELLWESAFATEYAIEVSLDGKEWKTAYATTTGKGGVEDIRFAPAEARWVRMRGSKRNSECGYSIYEFRVFR